MAKDSFLLDATRGSVGNVVVRRSGGRTILSSKPTSVANPRSYAQASTRMRLAAVGKFYSPLSDYLAKGVQGKTRVNSQSDLSSTNIRLMQELGIGVPKGYGWAPLPLYLTKGSKPELPIIVSTNNDYVAQLEVYAGAADINTVGDLARYLQAYTGITADEMQLTVVLALEVGRDVGNTSYQPVAERFALSTQNAAAVTSLNTARVTIAPAERQDGYLLIDVSGSNTGTSIGVVGAALIVTAWDGRRWLRTTSHLQVLDSIRNDFANPVQLDYSISTYMDSNDLVAPDGDVWLDGYTRRASGGGGGGGSQYDPSTFSIVIGDTTSALTVTGVTRATVQGAQVIALTLSDSSTHVLTGSDQMTTFSKAFKTDGSGQITLSNTERASAVAGTGASYVNLYAWVSEQVSLPLSFFLAT